MARLNIRRFVGYGGLGLLVILAIAVSACFWVLYQPLPQLDGAAKLEGLSAEVRVQTDSHGMPVIHASRRIDAARALGYVTARDRLFQMDLMRRKSAGRLAEIFGEKALESDIKARTYGYNRQAQAILAKLPKEHSHLLEVYAEGVNRYIRESGKLPFEFKVLGYRPELWQASDSVLVMLGMCENLTVGSERFERMFSVMEKALPDDLLRFLTPDTDFYTEQLLHQAESLRPAQAIPIDSLANALTHRNDDSKPLAQLAQPLDLMIGSNAWAVGGNKTWDGRAILANDMHLNLSVPNIWYRVELDYGDVHAAGLILPGTPLLVAGSNRHIAWGETNLSGDFLDLVRLEVDAGHPGQYKQGDHWLPFEELPETIGIKGGKVRQITVRQTVWGPVSNQPLLDQPVAVHWVALDVDAMNMGLFDLEESETLDQAVKIVNHAGGPQLNVLLADEKGHIAWTLMGRIPKRFGLDGLAARSWADGSVGWNGYVEASDLPRVIDPPEGILVSANDRRLGKSYPYVIGHQFGGGYRAYRIHQQLSQMDEVSEWSSFNLQLDSKTDFYDFYHHLALSSLKADAESDDMRHYLLAWDGRAETGSLGMALLVEFRKQLIESVFSPFLADCRKLDPHFSYAWTYIDTPLQALLRQKPHQLLPDAAHDADWDDFILRQLKISLERLKAQHPGVDLMQLNWGRQNKVNQLHPFSKALPLLGYILDMPKQPLPGCGQCVRAAGAEFGASERMVVSPGHFEEAVLHMPGGQSGQVLSPYYADQQKIWLNGLMLPFLAGKPEHVLLLKP